MNAAGGYGGAGIGGGVEWQRQQCHRERSRSGDGDVDRQGPDWIGVGTGATIGDGGDERRTTRWSTCSDGKEIQADINGLTTGYIHHIIYNAGRHRHEEGVVGVARPQPTPDGPNAPAEESNEVDLGTPVLHVETLEGDPLPFNARQQGSTLRVTTDTLAARLHGTRQALEALREQGVEQIQFVTTLKTTTLSVEDLLAEGGSWFALEHDGLVSRQLSAAQAESLKCRMR